MDKVVVTALEAVAEVPDGASLAMGGSRGGAIALGLPLGAPPLAGTAPQLARKGTGVGVATLCIGVGQGLTLVLER